MTAACIVDGNDEAEAIFDCVSDHVDDCVKPYVCEEEKVKPEVGL